MATRLLAAHERSGVARTVVDVIPHVPTEPAFNLPEGVGLPAPDDVDEEGYGVFRNVWYIAPGYPRDDARARLRWERSAVGVVDGLATTAEGFDALARVVEDFHTDGDHRSVESSEYPDLTDHERNAIEDCLEGGEELLDGLDLGVSALVWALSAAGFLPAASCRGHVGATQWSDRPAVLFAGTRDRVALLEHVIITTGCRLDDGSGNGDGLVAVHAPSVTATMDLAEALIDLDLPPIEPAARRLM